MIAARCALATKFGFAVLVIGSAREQDREGSLAGGAVDVGAQRYAVAGLHDDASLDNDFRSGLAQGGD